MPSEQVVYAFLEYPNGKRLERRFSRKNWEVIKNATEDQRQWKEIKYEPPFVSDRVRAEIENFQHIVQMRKLGILPEGVENGKPTRKQLIAKLNEKGIQFDADLENFELERLLLTGTNGSTSTASYSNRTTTDYRSSVETAIPPANTYVPPTAPPSNGRPKYENLTRQQLMTEMKKQGRPVSSSYTKEDMLAELT